jgi:hypothetical protein
MQEKTITIKPRKLARRMARAKLGSEKATGYNKERVFMGRKMPSRFSRCWKDKAVQAKDEAEARERARKKARA